MTVLHEDENGQIVELHRDYNEATGQLIHTYARFDLTNKSVIGPEVLLSRTYMVSSAPDLFLMDANELDALCEAWSAFKTNLNVEDLEERAWLTEALRIARSCPGLRVTEVNNNRGRWYVSLIKPGFAPLFEDWSKTPAQLLESVKRASGEWLAANTPAFTIKSPLYPVEEEHVAME